MNDIAVVIPVKNEEGTIQLLLESLERLQHKPREVVVVDGGSSDRTVERIHAYLNTTSLPYPVRVVETAGAFPGKARNIGIQQSTTPLVACTDAGGLVDPQWLGELVAPFKDQEIDLVVGRCESNASTFFEQLSFFLFLKNIRRKSLVYSGCASIAFRRGLWEKVGGFPEAIYPCEDKYFLIQARQKARRVKEAPSACVYWSPRGDPFGFVRQYFLYGKGDGRMGFSPIYHGLRFLAYGIGTFLFLLGGPFGRGLTGGALFVYVGEVGLRAFKEIKKGKVFLWVPFLLGAKDLSQMAGFLVGLAEGCLNPAFRDLRRALGSRRPDATD